MRVLITGATGLIGSEIVKICHEKGWSVNYLTRSKKGIKNEPNYKGYHWDIDKDEIDIACFDGVSAIINLAGATIAKRWTPEYKKTILKSRTLSLQLLEKSIRENSFSIEHIVSASAIGVYEDSLTHYYKESSNELSDSFLGKTVKEWEDAVNRFKSSGISVSKLRIGLVLSSKGGALQEMIKPIKLGVGAPMGSGDQWQSWIHINDLAQLFVYITTYKLTGIYNGVAPNPVTNKMLTNEIARVLGKPLLLPNVPKFIMKLILGEMHILLFESQRVSSEKIETNGYHFNFPNLKPALNDLLI